MKFKHPYALNPGLSGLSHILATVFAIMIVFDFLYEIVFWAFAELKNQTLFSLFVGFPFSTYKHQLDSYKILGEVTPVMRFLGWLASLISLSVLMYIYLCLNKLFSSFSKGYIFTIENINHIKKSAKALIVFMFLIIITDSLLSVVLSMNNPVGQRCLSISVGTTNLRDFIIALVIMVAAYVMEQGLELEEERQLII